jgi:hypothetical protein
LAQRDSYGGREVVFFQAEPVYMMAYYGWVKEGVKDVNEVYAILQGALRLIPENKPFRGPEVFSQNSLTYENVFEGGIENFSGQETIVSEKGEKIYEARYAGGLVDKK